MNTIIVIVFVFCLFLLNITKLKYFMNMLQIEGYKNEKYFEWMNAHKEKVYTRNDKIFVISLIIITVIFLVLPVEMKRRNISIIFLLMAFPMLFTSITSFKTKFEVKKPLIFTERAKRLYVMSLSVLVADFFITISIIHAVSGDILLYFPICIGLLGIVTYFDAYYVVIANYLVRPIEKSINQKFYDTAAKKVKSMENLISVGITGSYGKTSTKFATSTILEEKFKVLKTPGSYNTPMGISKIINNDLKDCHEIFLAELGAVNIGDIEEVAILTNPKIGLITSIGPCHLESFKSIDNIMRTKYELIEKLPNDGIAIFNYDNDYVKKLADKTFKEKILYSVENIEDTDIFAVDIKVSSAGSTFTLCDKAVGTIECETKLLGKHNISNLLAGAAVARALGMSLEDIAKGIAKVEGVEHRLQLIDPKTGVLVIDDAFNSNPDGARAAIDVLEGFKDNRKIIVTPGMVELGDIEEIENQKFGESIAKVCDIVILVGKKRTLPIYNGIKNIGFNEENIYVVNTLDESSKVLASLSKSGDVILFENDLPDTYNEE